MVALLALGQVARGQINLEWRVARPTFREGETVDIGLFAVSADGTDQTVLGVNANIGWDPAVMTLRGFVNNGPFQWPFSMFPFDGMLDGLNADCCCPVRFCSPFTFLPFNDGDAQFTASAFSPDAPPPVTATGLLIATLQFRADFATPAAQVFFLDDAGLASPTRVLRWVDGATIEVTPTLVPVTIEIAACGKSGDFSSDCTADLLDHQEMVRCLIGPDGVAQPGCDAGDFDLDGDTDLRDLAGFQRWFTGP